MRCNTGLLHLVVTSSSTNLEVGCFWLALGQISRGELCNYLENRIESLGSQFPRTLPSDLPGPCAPADGASCAEMELAGRSSVGHLL